MNQLSPATHDRRKLAQAIGSLLWKDPERILDAVSRLRGTGAVIECRLRGASMEPAIPRGSALRIDLSRERPWRTGEIVAFVRDSGICVHRIAYCGRGRRCADFIITQGDGCFYPDEPVNLGRVLGAVMAYRSQDEWIAAGDRASADRALSSPGRILLRLVAGLMEVDVAAARLAARALRLRSERAMAEDILAPRTANKLTRTRD